MSKNWRYDGFSTNYSLDTELQIESIKSTGNSYLNLSQKILDQKELTSLERELISAIVKSKGIDLIDNTEKYITKNCNGRNAHPLRYEILLHYYLALRVLNIKSKARFLTACHYLFSIESNDSDEEKISKLEENIRSWEKEDCIDSHIKKQADERIISNPERIQIAFEHYKSIWKK